VDNAYFEVKSKYCKLKKEKRDSFEAAREARLINIKDSARFWKTIKSLQFKP
jgi:hypothetical protein